MSDIRKVTTYELEIYGVFGRNRSEKFKSIELTERADGEPMADADVIAMAQAKLPDLKLKRGAWRVTAAPSEIRDLGGIAYKSTIMFGLETRCIHRETVG